MEEIENISIVKKTEDEKEKNRRRVSLGREIATIRKILDCTQSMFAEALDITPQTLSAIERGRFSLTNNLAAKLYFSLYELVKDEGVIEQIGLSDIQIIAINQLMANLRDHVSRINSELIRVVAKKGEENEN